MHEISSEDFKKMKLVVKLCCLDCADVLCSASTKLKVSLSITYFILRHASTTMNSKDLSEYRCSNLLNLTMKLCFDFLFTKFCEGFLIVCYNKCWMWCYICCWCNAALAVSEIFRACQLSGVWVGRPNGLRSCMRW